jgi:hypothetical protein
MAGDGSAYAALGLDPDADSAAIEQAYKRLIKQHHPDREGGDSARAAEINRAYEQLRSARSLKDPLELIDDWPAVPGVGRAWPAIVLLLGAASVGLFALQGPLARWADALASRDSLRPSAAHSRNAANRADPMDQPLELAAIDGAVHQALQLARRDEMALASASRDCHHRLRSAPSLAQLDRCAAFDDAVVELQDRDPLRDQGPFSEIAVTGRIWSGAAALSADSLAIDGRLDRIRLRVELVIARELQPPAAPSAPPPLNAD